MFLWVFVCVFVNRIKQRLADGLTHNLVEGGGNNQDRFIVVSFGVLAEVCSAG